MRYTMLIIVLLALGCAKTIPVPEAPERLPISDQVDEVVSMPEYVEPTKGRVSGLMEGDEAPFSGVLMDETKAFGAAELRIAYDELYRLSGVQKAAFGVSLRIMEQELQHADIELAKKDAILREIQNSWWGRHKLTVGVVTGVVLGIGGSFAAGLVWSKIDN
jgi:hypothetical protein